MGWDYALVHLKYTIPPSVALTVLYRPLLSKLDLYKICFLITIAVTSTIPWDSYLIRRRIWTYPPNAVLGYTVLDIPLEELFFFVIQTYLTSLLYLCLSRATFHPVHLTTQDRNGWRNRATGVSGQLILGVLITIGVLLIRDGGEGTYMGLILAWACPFMLLLWSLTHGFFLSLSYSNTLLPIALPTLYLWVVDTFALRRGTWSIESGTKLGIHVWEGLEVEEAVFFLVTNAMIVMGLVAFDNTMAIIQSFDKLYTGAIGLPSPYQALKALLLPIKFYDQERIYGFKEAIERLGKKSRSFYLASGAFQGRLRIDLVLLYSFCRVADDLVDNASSVDEAKQWISLLSDYLDMCYARSPARADTSELRAFISQKFPVEARLALLQLPVQHLSKQPLLDLLKGFEVDLNFNPVGLNAWPIHTQNDLERYGLYVAGTVAELCIDLVLYYQADASHRAKAKRLKAAGQQMGIALQIVNIARDIEVDAKIGRVYIPTSWLKEVNLQPSEIVSSHSPANANVVRTRLLKRAFAIYKEARGAIDELPQDSVGPMRVAIESYMEIGRVLRNEHYAVKHGRATVPKARRIWVAWKALNA